MRCLIILLCSLIHAHAAEIYRWYPAPKRFPEGDCFRMQEGNPANGYVEKVKPEECRPEKTSYLWANGRCYEVDSVTQGQSYGKPDESTKCAPANALYAFDAAKKECWLVDPANPNGYKARLNNNECRPPEDQLKKQFFPAPSGAGGDCLEIHKVEGQKRWVKRLETYDCKPADTKFLWRRTGANAGECWELASDGPEYYSAKTVNSYCRPENVSYRFERTGEKQGECFEVDKETGGNNWIVRVAASECRAE